RIGKFEEANGGTLLLDEISEMDPRLQAKLLRAVQEREIDRVGGTQPVKVDIRVIGTTNRDLLAEVRKGTFREDLYYRLNVVTLRISPLRDRPLDVLPLAEHFSRKYADANGIAHRPFSAAAREALLKQSWRGNVRELENTMHRAVLFAKGSEIEAEAIVTLDEIATCALAAPAASATAQTSTSDGTGAPIVTGLVGRTVADVERDLIIETVSHCLGNRTHAANILGISIRTLRNKLKQYSEEGIPVPMPGESDRVTA
ncbi:MAG TPA: sigma 54-interacting transcriptional regulator, partial [Alphaproteobacteria bacterium]|nr:sigma 54-interacting transcriptional regulator [Alphaproteobacteria bacterium]